jgi:hypothetical protein
VDLGFLNALQKREKKTGFSADPNLFSRQRGILGWGCHPLFEFYSKDCSIISIQVYNTMQLFYQ